MDEVTSLFVGGIMFVCGVGTVILAEKKGYGGGALVGWMLAGLFFNVIAVLVAYFVPKKVDGLVKQGMMKVCPYCKEAIKVDAVVCKHCRSSVDSGRVTPSL